MGKSWRKKKKGRKGSKVALQEISRHIRKNKELLWMLNVPTNVREAIGLQIENLVESCLEYHRRRRTPFILNNGAQLVLEAVRRTINYDERDRSGVDFELTFRDVDGNTYRIKADAKHDSFAGRQKAEIIRKRGICPLLLHRSMEEKHATKIVHSSLREFLDSQLWCE